MATITVDVPDTINIGRNGEHGKLEVQWDKISQHIKDSIAATYFAQVFTDKANSGGKDSSSHKRLELAREKLEQFYSGVYRARNSAGEPTDPIEAEAYRLAKPLIVAKLMAMPEAKQCPKGTKDRAQWVLDARDAAANREPREVIDLVKQLVESDPQFRKEAKRNVDARAKMQVGEIEI